MAIIRVGNESTAPSVRPSLLLDFANSKSMDPRVRFERSTVGTYWDGRTEITTNENLYGSSDTFWGIGGSTVTQNNTFGPDGTNTAHTIVETSILSYRDGGLSVTRERGYTTVSVHVKMFGTERYPYIGVRNSFSNWGGIIANTSAGTVTQVDTGNVDIRDGGIYNLGNGWYRIWATVYQTAQDTINMRFGMGASSTTLSSSAYFADYYTGDGASGMHVWGPQIESKDTVTAYTPTTGDNIIIESQPVLQSAPAGVPRFDHDPVTNESKGILLETISSTNLYQYTGLPGSRFNNAYNVSNYTIAPDGTKTAKLYIQAGGSSGYNYNSVNNVIGNNTYVISCFVKKGYGSGSFVFGVAGVAGILRTGFDVDINGVVSQSLDNSNFTEIEYGSENVGGGWYRVWIKGKTTNASGYQEIQLDPQGSNVGWYAWGFQIETGNFMTSYIYPTGSATTRGGETCQVENVSTSDWYAHRKGTLYVEGALNGFVTSQGLAGFRDTSDTGSTWNGIYVSAAGQVLCSNYSYMYGGSQGGNISSSTQYITTKEFVRAASSFSSEGGAAAISKNETVENSASRSDMKIPVHDILYVGRLGSGYSIQGGHVKKLAYYPEALSESELIALVEE